MVGFSGDQPFLPEATWPYPTPPTHHHASLHKRKLRYRPEWLVWKTKRLRKPKNFWSFLSGTWEKDQYVYFYYTTTLKFGSDWYLLFKVPAKSETGRIPFNILLTVKVQHNYSDVNVSSYRTSMTFKFGWDNFKCSWNFVIISERKWGKSKHLLKNGIPDN